MYCRVVGGLTASARTACVAFVRVTGVWRYLQQVRAVFTKLLLHAVRNWGMTLTQIVTPVFFVACSCGIIMTLPQTGDLPPLYLNLSHYRLVVVPYLTAHGAALPSQHQRLAEAYRHAIVSQVRSLASCQLTITDDDDHNHNSYHNWTRHLTT